MKSIKWTHSLIILFAITTISSSAYADFWSPSTSEEYPPLTSYEPNLINAFKCSGHYCDNLRIRNHNVNVDYNSSYWTSYFSEEGTNYRTCAGSRFMTGLACNGRYCDNLSLQCTSTNKTKGYCYWTPYFSEEAPYLYLWPGYYAAGMRCSGSYCDNKSIYACHAY
jgi:hypothetical protein